MNSSLNSGPLKRARQSELHLELKRQVASELVRQGFDVMFEYRLADVVAFQLTTGIIVAVEIELSPRNVVANLRRNLGNGFATILIVTLPTQLLPIESLVAPQVSTLKADESVAVISNANLLGALSSFLARITKKIST